MIAKKTIISTSVFEVAAAAPRAIPSALKNIFYFFSFKFIIPNIFYNKNWNTSRMNDESQSSAESYFIAYTLIVVYDYENA